MSEEKKYGKKSPDRWVSGLKEETPATDRITRPDPKPIHYCIYVKTNTGITQHYIYDYQCNHMDLIQVYKDALCSGLINRALVWDNGILDMNHIVGIVKQ